MIRRIKEEFVPVALKAALLNNPPPGVEGELYREIGRSKPAPQGICTANSSGKVLAWALSFDDDESILTFLDHVSERFRQSPDATTPVTAERFMRYPSQKLADVTDQEKRIESPQRHAAADRCPARPALQKGTLVGRIIGRVLGPDGQPVADTVRQERYMEARFEIAPADQERLAISAKRAAGKRFPLPDEFARSLVAHAFLGQLDVNPLGDVPGSRNDSQKWAFFGETVLVNDAKKLRVRIDGESTVAGSQDGKLSPRTDGRLWEHRVTLKWQGYVDIKDSQVTQLVLLADGDERLRWGNPRFNLLAESDARHLMAGHPIDFDGAVRYGLFAEPCSPDEVFDGGVDSGTSIQARLQAKMQRLQAGMRRLQQAGGDPAKIGRLMKNFGPLMQKQKIDEAESLLDEALKLLEETQ